MRLNVLIPTRGRPYQLAAAIYSLFMLASGEHEIQFCVACDSDDESTKWALRDLRANVPIFVRIGPRPDSLGSVANDLAVHWPADAYAIWADDLMCASYGWDRVIAEAVERIPHGIFWWTPARDVATYVPVITEKWRTAAGQIFTEYFPFWYDDLWLHEIWIMATDLDPQHLDIRVVDKPKDTQRMRDLKFWHDFYHAMRPERVKAAKGIGRKLGLPEGSIAPHFSKHLDAMAGVPEEWLKNIEKLNKAETGEPSEQYKRMKAKAEALMELHAISSIKEAA